MNNTFIKYLLIGGLSAGLDYCIYSVLILLNVPILGSNFIGYTSGTLASFFLNKNKNFKKNDRVYQRMFSFFCIAGLGFLLSHLIITFLSNSWNLNTLLSKAISMPFVFVLQFLLNKKITFR